MQGTSSHAHWVWSTESFWLFWGHCSRQEGLWFPSTLYPDHKAATAESKACSIPYTWLAGGELTSSWSLQLLLLQRRAVLTEIVMNCVDVEKNSTRESSVYCIIIFAVSKKKWGVFFLICLRISRIVFSWKNPSGSNELSPKQTPKHFTDVHYIQICSIGLNHSSLTL